MDEHQGGVTMLTKENQGKNVKEYGLSAVVTARDSFKA